MRPWAIVNAAASVNTSAIGTSPQQPLIKNQYEIPTSYNGGPSTPMFKTASGANGLLDTIEPRWFVQVDIPTLTLIGFQQVPYFEFLQSPKHTYDLETILATRLNKVIGNLSKMDKHVLYKSDRTSQDVMAFLQNVSLITSAMPYGALHFASLNHTRKRYSITMGFGMDKRLEAAAGAGFPSQGARQMVMLSQLDNALLRFSNEELGSMVITQGTRIMPELSDGTVKLPISGGIGRVLYPFGVSFLLPVFVIVLVREKEDRILVMMMMVSTCVC